MYKNNSGEGGMRIKSSSGKKASRLGKKEGVGRWTHTIWTCDNKNFFLKRTPAGFGSAVDGNIVFELTQWRSEESNRKFRERTREAARVWGIHHVVGLDPVLKCCSRPRPIIKHVMLDDGQGRKFPGKRATCENCGRHHGDACIF
jgi:hypothetical protein